MLIKKMTGNDVKALRRALGLTQKELSRKFGITISTLRSWEQETVKLSSSALAFLNILSHLTKRRCSTQDFLESLMFEPKNKGE